MLEDDKRDSLSSMVKEAAEAAFLEKHADEIESLHEQMLKEDMTGEEMNSFEASDEEPSFEQEMSSEFGDEEDIASYEDDISVPMSYESPTGVVEIDIASLFEDVEINISEDDLLQVLHESFQESLEEEEEVGAFESKEELEEEIEDPTMPPQPDDDELPYGAVVQDSPEAIRDENEKMLFDDSEESQEPVSVVHVDYEADEYAPGHIGGTVTRADSDKMADLAFLRKKLSKMEEKFAKIQKKQKDLRNENIYTKEVNKRLQEALLKSNNASKQLIEQKKSLQKTLGRAEVLLKESRFKNKKLTSISTILLDESLNDRQKNVLVKSIGRSKNLEEIGAVVSSKKAIVESYNKSQTETLQELGKDLTQGTTSKIFESVGKRKRKENKNIFGKSLIDRMKKNAKS